MRALLSLILGVGVFTVANGMPITNYTVQCPTLSLAHGNTHFEYDGDCEHYIQCKETDNGLWAEIRPCPFATYWKQKTHACMAPDQVDCQIDKCAFEYNGKRRGDSRNCRGFWECKNRKSVPDCCKVGQKFNSTSLLCEEVREDEEMCKASCFGDNMILSNETDGVLIDVNPSVRRCDWKPVPLDPKGFFADVPGHGPMKLYCGEGTVFNESECRCVEDLLYRKPEVPPSRRCNPDFHLSFSSKDFQDSKYYVRINDVTIKDGMGSFNGKNSSIVIPRFNNFGGVGTFAIDITYISNSSQLVQTQSILSNDCTDMPSVEILENDLEVLFSVGATDMNGLATTAVQTMDNMITDKKVLNYRFTSGYLKGTVNGVPSVVAADGYLNQVECDLVIGATEGTRGVKHFEGKIDDIKIYICDPDTNP